MSLAMDEHAEAVRRRSSQLEETGFVRRLWDRDASVWKGDAGAQEGIRNALGWLGVAETMVGRVEELEAFRQELRRDGFTHVAHCGMGGSSMAPLVFQCALDPAREGLTVVVLDTTDPATVLGTARDLPLETSCFVLASKSGTTAETRSHGEYFYRQVAEVQGDRAGAHFVAITDPGTPLEELARDRGFRRVFRNFPDIGGRYSALSYFGLVPAAAMGLDVAEILARAVHMAAACGPGVPVARNPGALLGAALGELARQGRNKVTFITPSRLDALGLWLEQLIAESTGKEGTGLLPVAEEPAGDPSVYGPDRVFVHFALGGGEDPGLDASVAALRDAGHPVVAIEMDDLWDLGGEFFRWEVATAAAGAVLGINPFDQPNVQESKDNTNRLLGAVRRGEALPADEPDATDGPLGLYAGKSFASVREGLSYFLGEVHAGHYLALMAYLTEEEAADRALRELRRFLRDRLKVATTLGYGPRFLHSTGQIHKGGPDTGRFLQLTADDAEDAAVPGEPFSFGTLKRAQAAGDLEALRQHGRRAIRIHLGPDPAVGLEALRVTVEAALAGA